MNFEVPALERKQNSCSSPFCRLLRSKAEGKNREKRPLEPNIEDPPGRLLNEKGGGNGGGRGSGEGGFGCSSTSTTVIPLGLIKRRLTITDRLVVDPNLLINGLNGPEDEPEDDEAAAGDNGPDE
uniref:Uncharacterized protein n=1 Tax=Tetranychus urticae TaxID=32264 RepID=T1KBU9_TETUR